ncbi:MAG: PqqD family protein [Solirubrobacteraceae bacterium]
MDGTRMPLARDDGLVIEELGDELLIYDMDRDHAHCLGPAAARVWRCCDGNTPATSIARKLGLEETAVAHALDELVRCQLLATPAVNGNGLVVTHTRRDFGLRIAKAGAAVASAPLIVSIVAPTAAHALTPCASLPFAGSCGICNQGGRPTPCCCCHGEGDGNANQPTSCRDDARACCCIGNEPSGANNCTEGNSVVTLCANVTC